MAQKTGQCLCGAVTFTGDTAETILACHCGQCQRWTGGGPYYAVRVSDLELSGAEMVRAYHASEWGERAVCATCGTTIYWKMQGKPPHSVAAGLLDDQSGMRVTEEIFVDYRAEWMSPFEGATQSTEAQEYAKLEEYMAGQKT
ncbi:MAG: GFA family protein [Boseongicola sp.]|nr:GFA family protein [Boseongicola sp.]